MNILYMVDRQRDIDGVKFQAQRNEYVFMVNSDYESVV